MDARGLAEKYFGSVERALSTGMAQHDDGALVLTHSGAKLIAFLIAEAKDRGIDTSVTEKLLIDVQTAAAIRQASRQFGPSTES